MHSKHYTISLPPHKKYISPIFLAWKFSLKQKNTLRTLVLILADVSTYWRSNDSLWFLPLLHKPRFYLLNLICNQPAKVKPSHLFALDICSLKPAVAAKDSVSVILGEHRGLSWSGSAVLLPGEFRLKNTAISMHFSKSLRKFFKRLVFFFLFSATAASLKPVNHQAWGEVVTVPDG